MSFQSDVFDWVCACFGRETARDLDERSRRFLEEALELVQACGTTREECLQLIDYVYARSPGVVAQEVGGAYTTLYALCSALGLDLRESGRRELKRMWAVIDLIRAKRAGKPT